MRIAIASVTRAKPVQSMRPVATGSVSATPYQTAAKQSVTATAGSASTTVIEVLSTIAPLVSAPTMTPNSSAATRNAADRRVSRAWAPVSAVRRWMMLTSSGSHTT